jgi:hypothetical protein
MGRGREALSFVNRQVKLAGRSCCAGRSWVGLDRSLARRAPETIEPSCEDAPTEMPAEPSEQGIGERTPASPVPH